MLKSGTGIQVRKTTVSNIADRLHKLGIDLPRPAAPVANYVPFVVENGMLYLSGQISIADGVIISGKVGSDITIEDGVKAARACAVNLIAQMNSALDGDLERVKRVVKLGCFVNCDPDFTGQPKVIDGASDLMVAVFGDSGRHARAAVGAPGLPLGAAVEVDAIVAIK